MRIKRNRGVQDVRWGWLLTKGETYLKRNLVGTAQIFWVADGLLTRMIAGIRSALEQEEGTASSQRIEGAHRCVVGRSSGEKGTDGAWSRDEFDKVL